MDETCLQGQSGMLGYLTALAVGHISVDPLCPVFKAVSKRSTVDMAEALPMVTAALLFSI